LALASFLVACFSQFFFSNGCHCFLLKATHPIWVPDKVINRPKVRSFNFFSMWPVGVTNLRATHAPTSLALTLLVVSLFHVEGSPTIHHILTLISYSQIEDKTIFIFCSSMWLNILQMSLSSSDIATVLHFGPSFHFWVAGLLVFSSKLSALSEFLLWNCCCLSPHEYIPCTVQEWHGVWAAAKLSGPITAFGQCLRSCMAGCWSIFWSCSATIVSTAAPF
jgi:hypothetical protein